MIPFFARHVSEDRLGKLAEGHRQPGSIASASPAERAHLEGCGRCRALLLGHERALALLTAPWTAQPVPATERRGVRARRRHRPPLMRLAESVMLFVVIVSLGLAAIVSSGPGGLGGRPIQPGAQGPVTPATVTFSLDQVDGRLAYSGGPRDGPMRTHVFDFDTATDKTVTAGPIDRSPSWSPDGERIAYQGGKLVDGEPEGLWVSDADGANARLIFDDGNPSWPSWSPDGRWIAFVGEHGDRGAWDLFIIRPDGTGLRQLSDTGGPQAGSDTTPDGFWGRLGWSPDSRSVATGVNTDPLGVRQFEIRSYGLDGRTETLVTDKHQLADPAWSPDGKELLLSRIGADPGDEDLYIRRADGRVERFADIVGQESQPAWSPDGQHVAFLWDLPDSSDIGIIRVADKAVTSVTDTPLESFVDAPSWCNGC